MKTQILFRCNSETLPEFEIAEEYFDVTTQRTLCENSVVIGRYSVLPYYLELAWDLLNTDCMLVNSWQEHQFIANMKWADLVLRTPKTYYDNTFCFAPEGQYIVKGLTNSKKFHWNTQMFAENKREASDIAANLAGDSLIGPQGIAYREYIPLVQLEEGLNGLPFSYEFRFFFLGEELLCHGFYWSIAEKTDYQTPPKMIEFAKHCAKKIAERTNFFVLDIAEGVDGEYYLIEINDGQMSGLSECDPNELYKNLRKVVDGKER